MSVPLGVGISWVGFPGGTVQELYLPPGYLPTSTIPIPPEIPTPPPPPPPDTYACENITFSWKVTIFNFYCFQFDNESIWCGSFEKILVDLGISGQLSLMFNHRASEIHQEDSLVNHDEGVWRFYKPYYFFQLISYYDSSLKE